MTSGLGGDVVIIGGQGGQAVTKESPLKNITSKSNSAIYHGSFTAGYFLYGDILSTIQITSQEDGLDLFIEEGQEGLFDIEAFFTVEGEEQMVSDWRDSWLSYIGFLIKQ